MLPLAPLVCTFLLVGSGVRPATRAAGVRCSSDADPIDVAGDDATFSACMKMRVSELKAELELRKVDFSSMFEKEELARCLADARASGRADPTLLDDFNRQSAEQAWTADSGESNAPDLETASQAVASDGGLPGGMSPEKLQSLIQDPEMMAMLRNAKIQEVMKKVMAEGADAASEYMDDPEVREMLKKVKGLTGEK